VFCSCLLKDDPRERKKERRGKGAEAEGVGRLQPLVLVAYTCRRRERGEGGGEYNRSRQEGTNSTGIGSNYYIVTTEKGRGKNRRSGNWGKNCKVSDQWREEGRGEKGRIGLSMVRSRRQV